MRELLPRCALECAHVQPALWLPKASGSWTPGPPLLTTAC